MWHKKSPALLFYCICLAGALAEIDGNQESNKTNFVDLVISSNNRLRNSDALTTLNFMNTPLVIVSDAISGMTGLPVVLQSNLNAIVSFATSNKIRQVDALDLLVSCLRTEHGIHSSFSNETIYLYREDASASFAGNHAKLGNHPSDHADYAEFSRARAEQMQRKAAQSSGYKAVEIEKHLLEYQMEVIRQGLPALPIPLPPEQEAQLIKEGHLPAEIDSGSADDQRPVAAAQRTTASGEKLQDDTVTTNAAISSYAERRRARVEQARREADKSSPERKYSGGELERHLSEYQMQVIRQGLPTLQIGLTPEEKDQLTK